MGQFKHYLSFAFMSLSKGIKMAAAIQNDSEVSLHVVCISHLTDLCSNAL